MTALNRPPALPTEHAPGGDEDGEIAARASSPSRYSPSTATGVRTGLVRTRTVRSNTRRAILRLKDDRGAATAEYIVATMAAVGFAGLLIVILRGDEVRGILTELVRSALTVG